MELAPSDKPGGGRGSKSSEQLAVGSNSDYRSLTHTHDNSRQQALSNWHVRPFGLYLTADSRRLSLILFLMPFGHIQYQSPRIHHP